MKELVRGHLVRRYKRFLADVILDSGDLITAHCPNTGSMKNCVEEGAEVWLSESDNPKRKYRYTWEYIVTSKGHWICVNTGNANNLVEDAVNRGVIKELAGYQTSRREVKYGDENSRIDLLLSGSGKDCYVEVKSVTLLETPAFKGQGCFPDAVSDRGAKHLRELMGVIDRGDRAVLLFCVQHTGIKVVSPADHIDQLYGELIRKAQDHGVEVIAYKVKRYQEGFRLWRSIPVVT
ncbi:MAG: DNA/RNA nuclease SfsA [Pseudomonadales bacterium]|nr:DNA/RNA nuclease SfsA [Pseudomonadales bacterium]MBO6597474.1 DNA/RNA nuclease SfsA [Pseudomonadales bacterium]MBO6658388.1 DNA/RNA nuclease SfsA [Pseudomonadales bacterium]MBO6824208.1 DNA/RNA nuclease SfsA [Pseudomonadales bacterium]